MAWCKESRKYRVQFRVIVILKYAACHFCNFKKKCWNFTNFQGGYFGGPYYSSGLPYPLHPGGPQPDFSTYPTGPQSGYSEYPSYPTSPLSGYSAYPAEQSYSDSQADFFSQCPPTAPYEASRSAGTQFYQITRSVLIILLLIYYFNYWVQNSMENALIV